MARTQFKAKFFINDKILEIVNEFNYLGYKLSFSTESDIHEKIVKFNKSLGILNKVMKSSLVQRHTRASLYKSLARPVLSYGSEAWTLRQSDRSRITASEMRFMRRTAGHSKMEHIKNEDILRELNMEPVLHYVKKYQ